MTTFELHLQVNQRYQEVASYKRDKFKPEEIDIALNKAMYRFLEKGVESSFQDTHINLSHVAALIQKNKFDDVYVPRSYDPLYEGNSVLLGYTVLPPDYYWLVNARAEVAIDSVNCGATPAADFIVQTEYTAVLPFVMPTAATTTPPYFAKVDISILNPVDTPYVSPYDEESGIHTNFNSKKSKYVIIENIVEFFYKHPTIKVYWERYRNVFYKDSFIFVSKTTNPQFVRMKTYDPNRTAINNTEFATFIQTDYSLYNRATLPAVPNVVTDIAPITIIKATDTYRVLKQNPFYKTRATNVIGELDHDYIRIYRDESFIVPRIHYDYIRKPRTISLALNQSCELADTTHDKIVDLAVEILRLDTKDPVYPQTVQDTQIRTNQ